MDYFKRTNSEIVLVVGHGVEIPFAIFTESVDTTNDLEMQPCEYYDVDKYSFVPAEITLNKDKVVLSINKSFIIFVQGSHFSHIETIEEKSQVNVMNLPVNVIDSFNTFVDSHRRGLWSYELKTLNSVKTFINQYKRC